MPVDDDALSDGVVVMMVRNPGGGVGVFYLTFKESSFADGQAFIAVHIVVE